MLCAHHTDTSDNNNNNNNNHVHRLLGSKRLTIILIFIGYWGQQAHATSQQAILLIFIAITTLTLGIYPRPNLRKSIPQQYMQCILMGAFYVKFNRRRG